MEYVRLGSCGVYDSDMYIFYIYEQRNWSSNMTIDEFNPSIYLQLGVF